MVVVSYSGKEINAKLVYYGAGLSGKTTNLESIYEAVPETSRGKMVSMKTQSDRTLFFDLLPLDLGEIMGFKTRFLLYTVPGQVFYNATRKLVLKGADAIVFVADSEIGKMDENKESLSNLRANLAEYGLRIEDTPWVIQYNKRDLPRVYSVDELNEALNPGGAVPFFEAVAMQGTGVFETFRGISHLLMEKVTRELRRAPSAGQRGARTEEAPRSEPAAPSIFNMATPVAPVATPAPAPAPATAARPDGGSSAFQYGRELSLPESGTKDGGASAPVAAVAASPASSPFLRSEEAAAAVSQASPERPGVSDLGITRLESDRMSTASTGVIASGAQELVVPVSVPRGGRCEIVLRIVLTQD